jgi:catechol 2,3-dioxygenase-like lactoylglutathione lyase family enzyme
VFPVHSNGTELGNGVQGVSHFGVAVADMEVSLAFYRDLLGLQVFVDRVAGQPYLRALTGLEFRAIRIVFLRVPGTHTFVELLEHHGIERNPVRSELCDPGNAHMCLYVHDLASTYARLLERGVPVLSRGLVTVDAGPLVGSTAVFVRDPDGTPVELNQPAPGGVPAVAANLASLSALAPEPKQVASR